MRWLSYAEADQLLAAARGGPNAAHLGDFIQLALNIGCRRGELLGLEWERVDLNRRTIPMARQFAALSARLRPPAGVQGSPTSVSTISGTPAPPGW
ncbi:MULTISPECIES: tyrosine-type recombinase/integrase [Thiorhodovibrio]|uniref:tyrosine-type recombinase/integrase n=1 Tax=Thiorhodovibrio TaxID=61593 RepID=UPI003899A88B